jgi:HSP20 family protein
MARLVKRSSSVEPVAGGEDALDVFGPIDRAFERMFGTWLTSMPMRHRLDTTRQWMAEAGIPVDEFHKDGSLVIRAELPGIDPDKDVELTITEGMLHLTAHRREETDVEDDRYVRQEIRYGAFERSLPLPDGVTADDVAATYKDGILEVLVPEGHAGEIKRIAVAKK